MTDVFDCPLLYYITQAREIKPEAGFFFNKIYEIPCKAQEEERGENAILGLTFKQSVVQYRKERTRRDPPFDSQPQQKGDATP